MEYLCMVWYGMVYLCMVWHIYVWSGISLDGMVHLCMEWYIFVGYGMVNLILIFETQGLKAA